MSFFEKNSLCKPNCVQCKLDRECTTPRMKYTGKGEKGILIISESPSKQEDKHSKHLVDEAGQLLRKELRLLNIDLEKDCWVLTAVSCRTACEEGNDVAPTKAHISNCRPLVTKSIKELKPTKIILLGDAAVTSFYSDRTTFVTSLNQVNGLKLWDGDYKAYVFPLWHPEFVQSKSRDKLVQATFKRYLKQAINDSSKPLNKNWNPIHKLTNFNKAIDALENCLKNDTIIAFDFETTGLDVFKEGHKTVSFGWANHKGAWAVPVDHPYWKRSQRREINKYICKILRKRKIKKIVHNLSFEYIWTKKVLGVEPINFFWDTLLATHVLDTRKGITKLKFQVFQRWGIGDYDKGAEKYITTDSKTGFNDMLKMPVDECLEYNAKDALYTFELYQEQLGEFEGRELEAYNFFHSGAIVLANMTYNGIAVRNDYYLEQRRELELERDELINKVMTSEEVKEYSNRFGVFNYDSPQHLQKILFEVLKLKPIKENKTGYSVDEDVLTKLGIELTKNILAIRKLNKMISTYIDGFLRLTQDNLLHPGFGLGRARSLRSSSSNPNLQNVPKRDPKAKKITRSGMVPRRGCVLGEMDFEGAEISTSCYYHKDPVFIKYQTEGGGDMHRDATAEILKINPDEVTKGLRQATKAVWTFSQFYGSYYVSCAKQGWEEYPLVVEKDGSKAQIRGMSVAKWMKKTFGTYKNFENHLKQFEDKFWNDWFKVYTQWKSKVVDYYVKHGYVETFMGFRFRGYMDRKQCTNYPIQGTSFHLLLYTSVVLFKELRKRGLNTLIVGQIHDSLILDVPVEELEEVNEILSDIVSTLHEEFTWMDFPMGLDFEVSKKFEDGGSFAEMYKFESAVQNDLTVLS